MTKKSSNTSLKVFYAAISEEILRICKAKTKFQAFTKSGKIFLIGRIIKLRGLKNHMKKVLLKLFNNQNECFIKSGKTNDYIFKKL